MTLILQVHYVYNAQLYMYLYISYLYFLGQIYKSNQLNETFPCPCSGFTWKDSL